MGRNTPSYHDYNYNLHKKHPALSLTFLIACIAATIAAVWALCGALSRKKPPGAPVGGDETPPKRNPEKFASSPAKPEFTPLTPQPEAEEIIQNGIVSRPLPPPPSRSRSTSCHVRSHSTPMTPPPPGKLESSVSARVSTGASMMMMRQGSRRGDNNNNNNNSKIKYLKHEDSVWKKAIILGEKCRVPDEDEEAIVYDEKGNRITTYHPKTKSSALERLSRQNSAIAEQEKLIHNA